MELLFRPLHYLQVKARSFERVEWVDFIKRTILQFLEDVKSIGVNSLLGEYAKRKLRVFNQLNLFQFLTGILVSVLGVMNNEQLPSSAWMVACLPSMVSLGVLYLNHRCQYEYALLTYFILYPFFTCVVYLNGMNLGSELFFILYGVLSVFFLRNVYYMLFSIAFSMISYYIMYVVWKQFQYGLASPNMGVYRLNQALAITYILYGLYLIKKENNGYQFSILKKNRALHKKNLEIQKGRNEIAEKARLLKMQTEELKELNTLKNKLFSVISHDLKSPMYALRNLFRNVQQYNMAAHEVKALVPEVLNDLNYTIGLMENLLQWSKSQMNAHKVAKEEVDISGQIEEVMYGLRLQAEAKQITIEHQVEGPVLVCTDRDVVNLVLRNLLSNAIKFTPQGGSIYLGANDMGAFVEVYVQDTGLGMNKETLKKINQNNGFTTKGTASESGTGLGLMLSREFLAKSGGQLHIESEPGQGSIFSFTLPHQVEEGVEKPAGAPVLK
ncbi:MAG TPA: HAMP domain-containing sensor histidine kinase [Chitinophagaceae bacterium]